jgi:hypothetical protein
VLGVHFSRYVRQTKKWHRRDRERQGVINSRFELRAVLQRTRKNWGSCIEGNPTIFVHRKGFVPSSHFDGMIQLLPVGNTCHTATSRRC